MSAWLKAASQTKDYFFVFGWFTRSNTLSALLCSVHVVKFSHKRVSWNHRVIKPSWSLWTTFLIPSQRGTNTKENPQTRPRPQITKLPHTAQRLPDWVFQKETSANQMSSEQKMFWHWTEGSQQHATSLLDAWKSQNWHTILFYNLTAKLIQNAPTKAEKRRWFLLLIVFLYVFEWNRALSWSSCVWCLAVGFMVYGRLFWKWGLFKLDHENCSHTTTFESRTRQNLLPQSAWKSCNYTHTILTEANGCTGTYSGVFCTSEQPEAHGSVQIIWENCSIICSSYHDTLTTPPQHTYCRKTT